MNRYNFFLPDRQIDAIKTIVQKTDISSTAEMLRRMIDHCLQSRVLDEIVPSMSGRLNLEE